MPRLRMMIFKQSLDGQMNQLYRTSLIQKVENANSSATKENICAAVNQLEAFKNQVEAQRGKKLTDEEADELIETVREVISNIQE